MDIYWISMEQRGRLGICARPRGGDWLDDDVRAWKVSGVDVVVSLLTPGEVREVDLGAEPDRCTVHGIAFRAFPITDRGVPEQPADFLALVADLTRAIAAGGRVLVHCRQGIGRSAITAAAVLVLTGETPERALAVVAHARGRPVPDTPEQRAWVEALAAGGREEV
ncbi:MAG: dual specificity protein phosphatase family protein [Deltaproteobacteria bacterium]|nr:dual specificity protein phosphatase family protein [Deltaproteobacteria bacterium]